MPKKTFFNLEDKKRKEITVAFLREFAVKLYDEASLSTVVKQLGIAKGSMYQYFDNKLDLYMYLIEVCSSVKVKYVGTISRSEYPDFWAYFRALYESGFQFDAENPLESHFLHHLPYNLNSPSVMELNNQLLQQTVAAFEQMAVHEIQLGHFRDHLPAETMGFLLFKVGVSIREHLEFFGIIHPKLSIQNNEPVYQGKKEALLQTVEEYIELVKPAFDKSK